MTDFYKILIEKSGFDKALIHRALDFCADIDMNIYSRLFFDKEPFLVEDSGVLFFEEAFFSLHFYDSLKALGLPCEQSALYIYICLLEKSYSDFCKRNIPENIFFDTAKRIFEAYKVYTEDTEKDGLYDYHFVANHVRGSILRLGVFEYQLGIFDDKKCCFIHVPDYADLSKDTRHASYNLARKYFGNIPIIADSWILYPEHKKMLSNDSGILDFMNDFDIISTHETSDYSELFHVFRRLPDYSYENLPKETSLQKAYAERVKNKLPVGSAIGKLKY